VVSRNWLDLRFSPKRCGTIRKLLFLEILGCNITPMKSKVTSALEHGIAAHKAGDFSEAERYYLSILQTEPTHPQANHHLGMIAMAKSQPTSAIPFFRVALEAEPEVEQCWVSLIEALLANSQLEEAQQCLVVGKKSGVIDRQSVLLELKLAAQLPGTTAAPAESLTEQLLDEFQAGRLVEAEVLAQSLIHGFPNHLLAWKVLGSIYGQSGRNFEALIANQKSVELAPDDSEAWSNLGVTLRDLGRLEEAITSYERAIEISPNFSAAHMNLGNAFKQMGKLDEAAESFDRAARLDPENPRASALSGITPALLGKLSLASFESLVQSIDTGDVEQGDSLLSQIFALQPKYIAEHCTEYIALWCQRCQILLAKDQVSEATPIFTKLLLIGERDANVASLVEAYFNKVDVDTAVSFSASEDELALLVGYCQFKALAGELVAAEGIARDVIERAQGLLRSKETEDLGWLLIRRCLAYFVCKDVAKKKLTELVTGGG